MRGIRRVRGIRLAHGALAAIAITAPAAGMAAGVSAPAANAAAATGQQKVHQQVYQRDARPAVYESFDRRAATYVKSLERIPYHYGGTSRGGFDCSGLTQYVYAHLGKNISRTAESQYREFRRISKAKAWGGDLVFFHDNSNPASYVYHVGIYEGGNSMVAASSGAGRVIWESFAWAGNTVTFGTITH
jgi:cell wall-associated NlpC family hydrolase